MLVPENSVVMIRDSSVDETTMETEKWYGTKYKVSNIPEHVLSEWKSPKVGTNDLHMPLKNHFIPTDVSLVVSGRRIFILFL